MLFLTAAHSVVPIRAALRRTSHRKPRVQRTPAERNPANIMAPRIASTAPEIAGCPGNANDSVLTRKKNDRLHSTFPTARPRDERANAPRIQKPLRIVTLAAGRPHGTPSNLLATLDSTTRHGRRRRRSARRMCARYADGFFVGVHERGKKKS